MHAGRYRAEFLRATFVILLVKPLAALPNFFLFSFFSSSSSLSNLSSFPSRDLKRLLNSSEVMNAYSLAVFLALVLRTYALRIIPNNFFPQNLRQDQNTCGIGSNYAFAKVDVVRAVGEFARGQNRVGGLLVSPCLDEVSWRTSFAIFCDCRNRKRSSHIPSCCISRHE